MKKSISLLNLLLLTLLVSACSQDQAASTEDAQSANKQNTSSINEQQGLVCTRAMGSFTSISYVGLSEYEGKPAVAIRTEQKFTLDDESENQELMDAMPVNLTLDNGESGIMYTIVQGSKGEKGAMSMDVPGSTFDPNDLENVKMMAGVLYGDCKPWNVDTSMLVLPSDLEGVAKTEALLSELEQAADKP